MGSWEHLDIVLQDLLESWKELLLQVCHLRTLSAERMTASTTLSSKSNTAPGSGLATPEAAASLLPG